MSVLDIPIPNAPEPFSGAAVAPDEIFEPPTDIILRSSDSVDFHCHKNILAHASQFFFDMFGAVCENDDIHKDGKAVIPIKETSGVLYKLLILVYPAHVSAPFVITDPAQLDDICAVHEAANKYQMVRTEALVEDMLVTSPLVDAHPHRFFAIASIRDIKRLLRKAALCTLRDTVDAEVPFIPEFDAISGNHVRELNNFIQRCGKRAQTLASQTLSIHFEMLARGEDYPTLVTGNDATGQLYVWWREDAGHSTQCGPTTERMGGIPTQEILPPQWYQTHMRQVATALRLLPNGSTALAAAVDVAPAERAAISACPACQQSALQDLVNLASQLARVVEGSNEKVVDEMWT
ncbi:hypothetical protein C8F04DRAFT_1003925 [Mycena alexandri]|uniref:BTB domain-containing protein n=1 Tax=Mycena alexandri TaxID=1745969 RepID=A0AAD6SSQ7_9AGAR|nr:hypothetical protein C8F04DRAFT_1003925 [Mycena alexandri]